MSQSAIRELVRSTVIDSTGIEPQEYSTELALGSDLGLGSLEILDMFFRVERLIPQAPSIEELASHLQGPVPDEEFCDERGMVSQRGLEWLHTIMPQIDPVAWHEKLHLVRILPLITIGNVIAMLEELSGRNEGMEEPS